jgi:hypothetical protein
MGLHLAIPRSRILREHRHLEDGNLLQEIHGNLLQEMHGSAYKCQENGRISLGLVLRSDYHALESITGNYHVILLPFITYINRQ